MIRPLAVSAAATLVALGSAATPASARDGWSPGTAAAVGVIGGLAAGAAIGSATARPYYPGRPVYAPPPPPEYLPPPPRRVYYERYREPDCYWRERRYVDRFGDLVVRRTQVCD